MNILEFQNVYKSFDGENGCKHVLNGVSFVLPERSLKALLGRSGSGKTTLLRLAAGFEKPDQGTIRFDAKAAQAPSHERFMVFQEYNQLFPWKRVEDNIVFALRAADRSLSKKKAEETAKYYLEETGLGECGRLWPMELSGGMKQRAALARAFALRPKLLLLDEPFAGLDAVLRKSMQELLLSLCKKHGMSALFVTHDIDEALHLDSSAFLLPPDGKAIITLCDGPGTKEQILDLLKSVAPQGSELS